MSMLELFTSKDGANGGIFGMVKKFEDALANGQAAQEQGLQIQLAILQELRTMNEHLVQLRGKGK